MSPIVHAEPVDDNGGIDLAASLRAIHGFIPGGPDDPRHVIAVSCGCGANAGNLGGAVHGRRIVIVHRRRGDGSSDPCLLCKTTVCLVTVSGHPLDDDVETEAEAFSFDDVEVNV